MAKNLKTSILSTDEVDDVKFENLILKFKTSAKQRKPNGDMNLKDTKLMLLNTMKQQMLARKQAKENILSHLSSILETLEADLQVLSRNVQKLQHMVDAASKSSEQNINATKKNIKAIKSIQAKFKKQCKELESEENAVNTEMVDELGEYIKKMQLKLISDTKKKQLDSLRKSLFQAMNDV